MNWRMLRAVSVFRAMLILSLGTTAFALPSLAHHSTLPFDGQHPITIRGVVTQYDWRNPHFYVRLDVTDDAGRLEHWTIETESLILLRRLGWTKDLLKPGDVISTTGAPAKNGTRMMRCKVLDLPDGRELPCFPN